MESEALLGLGFPLLERGSQGFASSRRRFPDPNPGIFGPVDSAPNRPNRHLDRVTPPDVISTESASGEIPKRALTRSGMVSPSIHLDPERSCLGARWTGVPLLTFCGTSSSTSSTPWVRRMSRVAPAGSTL